MFTRDSTTGPAPLEPVAGARPNRPPSAHMRSAEAGKSVVSNDLRIIGQSLRIIGQSLRIISRGTLQVDGEVEGDVGGAEIIIGEEGKVTGTVVGLQRHGHRANDPGNPPSHDHPLGARVEGDIHHMSLVIEQGAEFDGRCRRSANASELQLDLDA